jgi:hypothetical protein
MIQVPDHPSPDYTQQAEKAVLAAVLAEPDFGGWLAGVLARVAAHLGSTTALTVGRPGSWEAQHVQGLANGTVGWDDEYLDEYKEPLP